METTLKKNFLLGVGITNENPKKILEYILLGLSKKGKNYYVVTPNPEILVYANKDSGLKTLLNDARLALCDGIGVFIAGKFVGKPFVGRTTGTDFVKMVCEKVSEKPITVGFLGGEAGVAERTAECLLSKYPELRIGFVGQEWSQEGFTLASRLESRIKNQESREEMKKRNHNSLFVLHDSIDILFVAFGFPKQEKWMAQNLSNNIYRVAIGVGGAFDYLSGKVPRAPVFVQKAGFEWLFRLFVQPWRFKRQLALIEFVYLVLKEKISKKANSIVL